MWHALTLQNFKESNKNIFKRKLNRCSAVRSSLLPFQRVEIWSPVPMWGGLQLLVTWVLEIWSLFWLIPSTPYVHTNTKIYFIIVVIIFTVCVHGWCLHRLKESKSPGAIAVETGTWTLVLRKRSQYSHPLNHLSHQPQNLKGRKGGREAGRQETGNLRSCCKVC